MICTIDSLSFYHLHKRCLPSTLLCWKVVALFIATVQHIMMNCAYLCMDAIHLRIIEIIQSSIEHVLRDLTSSFVWSLSWLVGYMLNAATMIITAMLQIFREVGLHELLCIASFTRFNTIVFKTLFFREKRYTVHGQYHWFAKHRCDKWVSRIYLDFRVWIVATVIGYVTIMYSF